MIEAVCISSPVSQERTIKTENTKISDAIAKTTGKRWCYRGFHEVDAGKAAKKGSRYVCFPCLAQQEAALQNKKKKRLS